MKMWKVFRGHSVIALGLLVTAFIFASLVSATPITPGTNTTSPTLFSGSQGTNRLSPPPVGGHRGMMDPAQQLEGMTKRYNLSADQQTQLKPILASQQQQMQALRWDSLLSREDRMAKMQSIRADTKTKIELF